MKNRRKLNRRQSSRNFRRGAKVNGRNFITAVMRGGYRL